MSDLYDSLDSLSIRYTIKKLSPLKQRIALALVEGDNFYQISKREGIKTSKIYKIRDEMANELLWLKRDFNWNIANTIEDELVNKVKISSKSLTLLRFVQLYLEGYTDLDFNVIKKLTTGYNPTDSEKVIIVISVICKILFTRSGKIIIDYYYSDRKILVNFIKKFKLIVKSSPILNMSLNLLQTDADLGIKLKDGSEVRAIWTLGRLPQKSGNFIIIDSDKDGVLPKITLF